MPRHVLAFAWLLAACLSGEAAWAQAVEIRAVQLGWDGHFKHGHWCEVRCEVQAGSDGLQGALEVISHDGDGATAGFVCPRPIDLKPDESSEFTTLVKLGPPQSGLRLRVRRDDQTLAETGLSETQLNGVWNAKEKNWSLAHRSTALVVVTLGPSAGVESSLELLKRATADEVAAFSLASAASLPESPRGYDAIDLLVVVASESQPLSGISRQREQALKQWLYGGGRILLVAGQAAQELFVATDSWTLPPTGEIGPRRKLAADTGLKRLTGEALELNPPPQIWELKTGRTHVVAGETDTGTSDRPLIVAYPAGFGRVTLVLVDLAQPPLAGWAGRPRLLARVISGEAAATHTEEKPGGGRMTHLGYRDLSGQLRMALDQFQGVTAVHFYPIAGALLFYLLLLGPGEYFLLRKAAPLAMHLTWMLFPLLLIGFAGGAIALGRSARGTELKVNHLEIVDLDFQHGQQRGMFWTSLFSPSSQSLSLSAAPSPMASGGELEETQFAWQPLPGEGLGGVDTSLLPLSTSAAEPYLIHAGHGDAPATIERLPLSLASSKALGGKWRGTLPPTDNLSQLHKGKILDLEGSFRVPTPVALKSVYLAYGDWLYRAHSDLQPNAEINVASLERKHLEYQFTRRRVLKDSEFATPWNQEETDVPRILEVMMFHGALRGRSYTVLSHRYHHDLDLTHLIREGYAVLVGRAETPLMTLQSNGQPLEEADVHRWTYYRIIYPVAGIE
jgi:hypothetical protein